MKYEELTPIDRDDAQAMLSESVQGASYALLRLALHDPDWRFVQDLCLEYSTHSDLWVRRNVSTALGHLARLHGQLDLGRVMPVLERLRGDPEVAPWVEATLDDLRTYCER